MLVVISSYQGKPSKYVSLINKKGRFLIHHWFCFGTDSLTELPARASPVTVHNEVARDSDATFVTERNCSLILSTVSLGATQQTSPGGPLTGAQRWHSMLRTRGGIGYPRVQHSHSQNIPSWPWLYAKQRRDGTYFTVTWGCPGTTGQDRKDFGPRSASGVPRRARQELSWRQTATAQSTVLHTGSQGGGAWPLNWGDREAGQRGLDSEQCFLSFRS